ncbi:MAG: DNA polymerase III subunit delta [Spirochaetes bacterium]|nr:DNA polymerase III subunit delta [Spirochaetota bacterium]
MPPKAPAPFYILAGPEIGRREAFIGEIVKTCAAIDGSQPELHRRYASETGPEELTGLLRNGSLFASRRIVKYQGAETISTKAQIAAITDYLASPADGAVLLLVTEGYSLAKPLETAVGAANKIMFWELRDAEKPVWLKDRLAADGLSADEGAIDALLELVENETSSMESACLFLAACFPKDKRLSADEVEAALSHSRREDAFSLFDRMTSGDLSTALGVLDAILADRQSDPSQIVAALVWSFRKLRRIQSLAAGGESPEEAFRIEKILSKTGQKKFRAGMKRYSEQDCGRILRAISETEAALRGGFPGSYARPFLHLLVRSVMMKKGGGLILSGWKEREYYLSH